MFIQVDKKFPTLYGTKRFNIMFKTVHIWTLSWAQNNSVHTHTLWIFYFQSLNNKLSF